MAEKRMFSKQIIDSDAFLEMPLSAQCLYFHLSMRADDDGFLNNAKRIQRNIGASEDDLKILFAKRFLITFDDGIVVIKHWRIHNYIAKDRYKPTVYQDEMAMLEMKENRAYTLKDDVCIQTVYKPYTQNSIDKNRVEENSISTKEDKYINFKDMLNRATQLCEDIEHGNIFKEVQS